MSKPNKQTGEFIGAYVSEDDKAAVVEAAKKERRSVSSFITIAVLERATLINAGSKNESQHGRPANQS